MVKIVEGSPELEKALQTLLGREEAKPAKKGKGRRKLTDAERAAHMAANDLEAIKKFTAAGYTDVKPRVNVLTYGKIKSDGTPTGWLAKGRKVRAGEKAIRVGNFSLFHEKQTDPILKDNTPTANESAA